MAQNCDPCVCPEMWYRDSQSWRKAVITLLCDIAGADDPPIHIGDVDINSFPSGNLGQQLMAASLSVVPASNITDATYIGDIKFGESIPSGSALIGAVKRDIINYTAIKKYYTSAGAVSDGIIWSPAGGKKWVITDLVINISAAATVTLEDDLSGGDSPFMKFEFAANGGCVSNFQTPIESGEADADLIITTTAGNVYVTVTGYEI